MRIKHARLDGPQQALVDPVTARPVPRSSPPSVAGESVPALRLHARAGSPQQVSRGPSLCFDTTVSIPSADLDPGVAAGRLPEGTTLQRYVLLERVGAGAMGVVYAAYDYGLDRKVAIKLLREPRNGISQRRRLMREAQALARLSHPNVVGVHDIGSYGDQVFIAMEYVDGRTLRRWREEERRSLREVLAVFRAAGKGLAAAHEAGIVHRDFKPDNVLVDRQGRARVSDFGLAKLVQDPAEQVEVTEAPPETSELLDGDDALTRTGTLFGTPAYMALEQHLCQREIDPRADQFSFAVALYEAACGVHPFDADTPMQIADNIRNGRIHAPRRRVPGWFLRALMPALAADPARRYPSMAALLRELRAPRPSRMAARVTAAVLAISVGTTAVLATMDEGRGHRAGVEQEPAWAVQGVASAEPAAVPLDPTTEARVAELRERNGHLRELLAAGRASDALPEAQKLVADAAALRHPPVHAEALLTLAELLWAHDEFPAAEDKLFEAVRIAEAGHAPRIAIEALLEGMWVVGEEQGRYAEARRYAQLARGKLAGMGGDDLLEARLSDSEGLLWLRHKHLDRARPLLERGLALYTKVHGPDSHQVSAALDHLGLLAQAEHRLDDAVSLFRRAKAIAKRLHGFEHSATLTYLAHEAKALCQAGRHDAAFEANRPGYELLEETDLTGVMFLANLGLIEWKRKRHAPARDHLSRALAIVEELRGPDHPEVAEIATDLGLVLEQMGRPAEATAQLTRAAAIYERTFGVHHPDLAAVQGHLARIHRTAGTP